MMNYEDYQSTMMNRKQYFHLFVITTSYFYLYESAMI